MLLAVQIGDVLLQPTLNTLFYWQAQHQHLHGVTAAVAQVANLSHTSCVITTAVVIIQGDTSSVEDLCFAVFGAMSCIARGALQAANGASWVSHFGGVLYRVIFITTLCCSLVASIYCS